MTPEGALVILQIMHAMIREARLPHGGRDFSRYENPPLINCMARSRETCAAGVSSAWT